MRGFAGWLVAGVLVGLLSGCSPAPLDLETKAPPDHKAGPKPPERGKGEGAATAVKVDPKLPAYEATKGVSGTIKSVGSDTMNNLMTLWSEGFGQFYPGVQVEVDGKGSSTGPPALIEGTASFAPMSREMKQAEVDKFEGKHGYPPLPLRTSIDMLAVYVHKDNPIRGLTLDQLDAVFGKTRKRGHKAVKTWGDLGVTDDGWRDKAVSAFGRNSASGTYGYFKERVLLDGDFKDDVKEQPGSSSVVQGVAKNKYAIGYSGIGYKTADIRAVPLRDPKAKGKGFVPAEPERAYKGDYPLARFLYVYVNKKPGAKLDPLRGEFVRYLFSRQGQLDVIKSGYLPVQASLADKERKAAGLAD